MTAKPPILVFDRDGTLAETAGDIINTLNVVLDQEGLPHIAAAEARKMIGAGAKILIKRGFEDGKLPDGCVMFGGTFAAKGGIRPADRFEFELEDPVIKRTIRHAYDVIALPVRG